MKKTNCKLIYNALLVFMVILFTSPNILAQTSGYLGKRSFLDVNVGLTPSFSKTHKIDNGQVKKTPNIVHLNIKAAYELIISKNVMMRFQYGFAPTTMHTGRTILSGKYFEATNVSNYIGEGESAVSYNQQGFILEDITRNRHSAEISLKIFPGTNLPPIGKYFLMGVGYGVLTANSNKIDIYPTIYGPNKDIDEKDIIGQSKIMNENIHFMYITLGLGNQHELIKNLFLTYSLSFQLPYFLDFFSPEDFGSNNFFGRPNSSDNSSYKTNLSQTEIAKQSLFSINIGLSYALF